jgi:hypothetical protein
MPSIQELIIALMSTVFRFDARYSVKDVADHILMGFDPPRGGLCHCKIAGRQTGHW